MPLFEMPLADEGDFGVFFFLKSCDLSMSLGHSLLLVVTYLRLLGKESAKVAW